MKQRDVEDAKERFYDAQLQRLELLDKLHDNELPIDVSFALCLISPSLLLYVPYFFDFFVFLSPYSWSCDQPC